MVLLRVFQKFYLEKSYNLVQTWARISPLHYRYFTKIAATISLCSDMWLDVQFVGQSELVRSVTKWKCAQCKARSQHRRAQQSQPLDTNCRLFRRRLYTGAVHSALYWGLYSVQCSTLESIVKLCTVYSIVHSTVNSTIHCTMHCTVKSTVHSTIYSYITQYSVHCNA